MKAPSVGRLVNFESKDFTSSASDKTEFLKPLLRELEALGFKVSDVQKRFMMAAFLGDDIADSTHCPCHHNIPPPATAAVQHRTHARSTRGIIEEARERDGNSAAGRPRFPAAVHSPLSPLPR